jgi:hypothetical protein
MSAVHATSDPYIQHPPIKETFFTSVIVSLMDTSWDIENNSSLAVPGKLNTL